MKTEKQVRVLRTILLIGGFMIGVGISSPTLLIMLIVVGIAGAVGFAIAAVISGFIQKVRH